MSGETLYQSKTILMPRFTLCLWEKLTECGIRLGDQLHKDATLS